MKHLFQPSPSPSRPSRLRALARGLSFAAGLVLITSQALSGAEGDRPLELRDELEATLPSKLKALQIQNPYVKVLVEVDETGAVIDAMPVEATHYGLLEKGVATARTARFEPAIVDGEPSRGRAAIYINFYDVEQRAWRLGAGIAPLGGSVTDAVESRDYRTAPERFRYGESKPRELDGPLRIAASKLRVYTSQSGVRQSGRCVVEYFVGPEGQVHFPRVVESDHEDLSMSALLTLEATTFEPPRHNGNPTYVRVRQPFNFD